MASALVNNPGVAPESLSPFPWLAAPRLSFCRDGGDRAEPKAGPSPAKPSTPASPQANPAQLPPGEGEEPDLGFDFEFRRLDDTVAMLSADELFSDGKLVPLQLSAFRPHAGLSPAPPPQVQAAAVLPGPGKQVRAEVSRRPCLLDQYVFSPKAPRCSSRWKELLGLKRAAVAAAVAVAATAKPDPPQKLCPTAFPSKKNPSPRGLKHFLQRNTKSASNDSSYLTLPLLRDSNSYSAGLSSARLSLSSSSSSSCPDHDDLPRLSLDSDKPRMMPPRLRVSSRRSSLDRSRALTDYPLARPGGRIAARRDLDAAIPPPRGASVDSPRLISSGKVVFQSLGRSSSSPSTFNGGPRAKHRVGMERSYSANVRITPVLNVPVCSLRGPSSKSGSVFGLGQIFSPHKKEPSGSAARAGGAATARSGSGGMKGEKGASGN